MIFNYSVLRRLLVLLGAFLVLKNLQKITLHQNVSANRQMTPAIQYPPHLNAMDLTSATNGNNTTQVLLNRPRVAVLFKLHTLDANVRERIRHLLYDLIHEPDAYQEDEDPALRKQSHFEYHLFILYDANVVNASEVIELRLIAAANSRVTLFPFTALAMHKQYPTQYPKSDFQAPKSPWTREPLQGRLRHITHDNPEMAYLLWWREQNKHGHDPILNSRQWSFVWGCEYDVAMAPTRWLPASRVDAAIGVQRVSQDPEHSAVVTGVGGWVDFFEDSMIDDKRMSGADLVGTMVGWRPWKTWTFGGRINFGMGDGGNGSAEERSSARDMRRGMYCPLLRFSPFALDLLHDGYSQGRVGYVEVAVATTCAMSPDCVIENITSRWLGHFDYRPVISPDVFFEVAKQRPGLLFHPVKYGKPLSSILIDKAHASGQNTVQEPWSATNETKLERSNVGLSRGRDRFPPDENRPDRAALSFSVEGRRQLESPPAKYRPASYFLGNSHVPWE